MSGTISALPSYTNLNKSGIFHTKMGEDLTPIKRSDFALAITAGWDYVLNQPNEEGCERLKVFVDLLRADPEMLGGIIGGYIDCYGLTLGKRYYTYSDQEYPDVMNRVHLLADACNASVDNLVTAAPKIEELLEKDRLYIAILLCTYRGHANWLTISLEWLKYRLPERKSAGVNPEASGLVDAILAKGTKKDPLWRESPIGLLFRIYVLFDAKRHWLRSLVFRLKA